MQYCTESVGRWLSNPGGAEAEGGGKWNGGWVLPFCGVRGRVGVRERGKAGTATGWVRHPRRVVGSVDSCELWNVEEAGRVLGSRFRVHLN